MKAIGAALTYAVFVAYLGLAAHQGHHGWLSVISLVGFLAVLGVIHEQK